MFARVRATPARLPAAAVERACVLAGWAFAIAGALARIWRYLDARPLWGDEASLALNILRDFGALLEPLRFGQSAPSFFPPRSRHTNCCSPKSKKSR